MQRFLHFFIWWVILDTSVYYKEIPQIPIPYNCKFIFAQSHKSNAYKLIEIYNLHQFFFKLVFGEWTRNTGLVQTPNAFFSRNRFDFNGTKMILFGNKVTDNPLTKNVDSKNKE